jgi:predicted flap endonuclease-1-like 5' DNA nuclease
MEQLTEFIDKLPSYAGIFALMLSTFLIGYFSAWGMLKANYQRLLKRTVRKSNKTTSSAQKVKDIDVIFTEIKPKIIKVVKEAQEEIELQKELDEEEEEVVETKSPTTVAETARTSYITYTHNKPKLNFDNFGHADPSQVQDLTRINGIGPYIEQKLNEIGIYNYEQISRFKDEDIRVLTELIDFFPGRIERDNWVEQADELVN